MKHLKTALKGIAFLVIAVVAIDATALTYGVTAAVFVAFGFGMYLINDYKSVKNSLSPTEKRSNQGK